MTLDVGGGLESADDQRNTKTTTEEADVTNETSVKAIRSNQSTSADSNTWQDAFDGENHDARGEFSAPSFTPDKTGDYLFVIRAEIEGSTTAGDEIRARNNGADSERVMDAKTISAGGKVAVWTAIERVTAGTTVTPEVINVDSSSKIGTRTDGVIKRVIVNE